MARLWSYNICSLCCLPARHYATAGNSDRKVSVRLSVCLSVMRRNCVKMKKRHDFFTIW